MLRDPNGRSAQLRTARWWAKLHLLLANCTTIHYCEHMTISREISRQLIELFRQYPIVTVTGPRQSGKTVLCRSTFPGLGYADLGMPHERDFAAAADPRGFLARLGEGAIIDEVQRVPDLLSHLQGHRRRAG